jgi:AcrR family transcriptional regulator
LSGLRAKGRKKRRAEIVAAAAVLWRHHDVDEVSMAQIAEAAEVSPQTIYNLFGGQNGLIFAVIEALLDRLEAALARLTGNGVARSLACVATSAMMFREEAALYRQLVVRIPKALFDGAHYARDNAHFQIEAIKAARGEGDLIAGADPVALGRQLFIGYMGALYAWGCGGLDGPGFSRAAELAALLPLAAMASDRARPDLQAAIMERLVAAQEADMAVHS